MTRCEFPRSERLNSANPPKSRSIATRKALRKSQPERRPKPTPSPARLHPAARKRRMRRRDLIAFLTREAQGPSNGTRGVDRRPHDESGFGVQPGGKGAKFHARLSPPSVSGCIIPLQGLDRLRILSSKPGGCRAVISPYGSISKFGDVSRHVVIGIPTQRGKPSEGRTFALIEYVLGRRI